MVKEKFASCTSSLLLGSCLSGYGTYPFAVDKYLDAIQLMPGENEFLAMIYDNLAECYEDEDLYDVAIESYRKSYQIVCRDKNQYLIR